MCPVLLIQTLQCLEMAFYTLSANQEACHEEAVILGAEELLYTPVLCYVRFPIYYQLNN